MRIETLVVTVDQTGHCLVEQMNLQTDSIVGNQADREAEERFRYNGANMIFLTDRARGVGRNRNKVLERATADILVLADDDMRFVDGYPEIVEKAFAQCPDADILVFNLIEKEPRRYINKKIAPVGHRNYARYGAARIALRRETVLSSGIRFSLLFGGGAKYGSGEDTIFLHQCLKKGLKIMAVPYALAQIDQTAQSTWFRGYDEKFFRDKGALYTCLHGMAAPLFCARYLIKYRRKFQSSYPLNRAWPAMLRGIRDYRDTIHA